MKIICAGFCKTGTKTMYTALRELGYEVYDYLDHFWVHGEEWEKILAPGPGGTEEDFKRMYQNVDAVTDGPPLYFWEEIHKAFPNAKIILTTRDENQFYKSIKKQVESMSENLQFNLMVWASPTGRKYFRHHCSLVRLYFGMEMRNTSDHSYIYNEQLIKKTFRKHQNYCLQNAPKDKLLVYQVKEGWEPLCKFLGKEIPQKPFPHDNIAGGIIDKLMATHPSMLRVKKELYILLFLLVAACSVFFYFFVNI